jgi:hypothetical protein
MPFHVTSSLFACLLAWHCLGKPESLNGIAAAELLGTAGSREGGKVGKATTAGKRESRENRERNLMTGLGLRMGMGIVVEMGSREIECCTIFVGDGGETDRSPNADKIGHETIARPRCLLEDSLPKTIDN